MALQAAVQRRVDAEADTWAAAFPDPQVPDAVLRAAASGFAESAAPALQPAPEATMQPPAVLGATALVLALLALVALLLPLAAVPLLVLAAIVLFAAAWSAAGRKDGAALGELRGALRDAAYAALLARRAAAQPGDGIDPAPPGGEPTAGRLDHVTLQGRATYAAAAALDTTDGATVIDL